MMKKHIFLILFLLISNVIISQKIENGEIIGKWKVEKNLTKNTNPKLKDLIEGFRSSTFKFDQNGTFEMSSLNKSKLFLMTMEMINHKKWRFNSGRQLIQIGSEKDYFSLMGINVKKTEGKVIFEISESEMQFEMVKS